MAIQSRVVNDLLYLGIKGGVLAMRKSDGTVAWFTKLRRGITFVPLILDGDRIYAASCGEVSCLDAVTGTLVWHNELKGYGVGYAAIAGASFPIGAAALEQAARGAAAGGAVAAMG